MSINIPQNTLKVEENKLTIDKKEIEDWWQYDDSLDIS